MTLAFPAIPLALVDGDEQSTSAFRVVAKFNSGRREVTIRVDRAKKNGRPLYDTLVLTEDEADALLICLMNEIG